MVWGTDMHHFELQISLPPLPPISPPTDPPGEKKESPIPSVAETLRQSGSALAVDPLQSTGGTDGRFTGEGGLWEGRPVRRGPRVLCCCRVIGDHRVHGRLLPAQF